jgi:hypothetical protein
VTSKIIVDLEPSGEFEALNIFANNVTRKNMDLVMTIYGTRIGYSSYQLYGYCNKQHCYWKGY